MFSRCSLELAAMGQRRPSIEAVARRAGVSIATVSRVLTGSKPVAHGTRQRVEAAATALGYAANPFGRALSGGATKLLLMLVPEMANSYYAEIIRGATTGAQGSGYTVLPVDLEGVGADDERSLQMLAGTLADGVINLVPLVDRPRWLDASHARPWVNCSEFLPGDDVPYVSIDHTLAATEAVQYLLNRGHRRIALVNTDERFLYARQRREGYERALARARIKPDATLIVSTGANRFDLGVQAVARLLSAVHPPTAVFAVSDTLAVGVIKGLRHAGRRVPDDVAVMGFDDVPIAEVFEPGITTVAQPMLELGKVAVEMILARLAGENVPSRVLPHRLVLRESA